MHLQVKAYADAMLPREVRVHGMLHRRGPHQERAGGRGHHVRGPRVGFGTDGNHVRTGTRVVERDASRPREWVFDVLLIGWHAHVIRAAHGAPWMVVRPVVVSIPIDVVPARI